MFVVFCLCLTACVTRLVPYVKVSHVLHIAPLSHQVRVFGEDHPFTELVPNLTGVDPDDAFSIVPYEKGSSLLMYLEEKLGGPGMSILHIFTMNTYT